MKATSNGSTHQSVFVVTVTYGRRQEMLQQMVAGTLAEGIRNFVVVDNGAHWDVNELAARFPSAAIRVVTMGANQGSAAGFAAGMSMALESGAEMIWLLDDDNRPHVGALSALQVAYDSLLAEGATRKTTAVLAFRPEHQADVAMGVSTARINARRSSFLGFHLFDIPNKLWRRMPLGRPTLRNGLPATVCLHMAPYSGLLLHREAIETIGMPRADFVLYADDSEWSYRITRRGGRIVLVTAAQMEDLESSWNVKRRSGSALSGMLLGAGDFRAYYSTRNAAFFHTHCLPGNRMMRAANRHIYMTLLWCTAQITRRQARYRLLRQAVDDGCAALLGRHQEHPL